MEEKISIFNKEKERLIGLKSTNKASKAIILVHGFGVTKEEYGLFDVLASKLIKNGFCTYRFDFSGRGESEGDYSKTSLTKLKSDFEEIYNYVKSQHKEISIIAQSFGTCVYLILNPEVKTAILMGSMANPKNYFNNVDKWDVLNKKDISVRTKKTSGEKILIDKQFWPDLEKYDLLELIKKVNCPLLFIHGEKDTSIPLELIQPLFDNANLPKKKIIIKGAPHGMDGHREEVAQIVTNWFKKYF